MPAKKRIKKVEIPVVPIPEPSVVQTQASPRTSVEPRTTTSAPLKKKPRLKLPTFHLASGSVLNKLRLALLLIFGLSTLSIIMVFVNFSLAVILILISYVILFVLLVKLFMVKKL